MTSPADETSSDGGLAHVAATGHVGQALCPTAARGTVVTFVLHHSGAAFVGLAPADSSQQVGGVSPF
ncbi:MULTISPECIES: hypothetical protein [unclassified Streptomyces]|uniref:hypothetical protein n=1 Tax=Streptomyces TaxID=1883 RepID=UPI0025B32CCB|nr:MULTISPECIES: hypothetical protein [unclassified Streptomyces]MDN3247989.1 hypothetical protein [Streptomyces sp. ZSW22]MDN3256187.1 hypothetical protein [Streptomyces sp. MA25(2023)]